MAQNSSLDVGDRSASLHCSGSSDNDELTDKEIDSLSIKLGPSDWKRLANQLGFLPVNVQVEILHDQNPRDLIACIRVLLCIWRDIIVKHGENPRLALANGLIEIDSLSLATDVTSDVEGASTYTVTPAAEKELQCITFGQKETRLVVTPRSDGEDSLCIPEDMQYYDAMILYSEEDRKAVKKFKEHLNNIDLCKGQKIKAVLYDGPELRMMQCGKFDLLEKGFKRCTFALLYYSVDLLNDREGLFHASCLLMKTLKDVNKRWCVVPVWAEPIRNASYKQCIPMCLNTLLAMKYYENFDEDEEVRQDYRDVVVAMFKGRLKIRLRDSAK